MKLGSFARISFYAFVLVMLFLQGGEAKQRIIRMRAVTWNTFGGLKIEGQSHTLEKPWDALAKDDRFTFEVYEAAEIDEMKRDIDRSISGAYIRIDNVQKAVDAVPEKIKHAEDRISSEIKDSIDKIPQRLLTDEAKKAIIEAVSADVKSQIDTLRSDLQKQINDLKARR